MEAHTMEPHPQSPFMTIAEVMAFCRFKSRNSVPNAVKAGRLPPPHYVNRQPLWNRAEVRAAFNAAPTRPKPKAKKPEPDSAFAQE
jgi:hypothetical protein